MEIDMACGGSAGLPDEPVGSMAGANGGVVGILRFFSVTRGGPDMPEMDGAELPIEFVLESIWFFGLPIGAFPENDCGRGRDPLEPSEP